ncbi:sugar ABC transporter permease [Paenibacillus albidus]|uniref:Sugar ABC transporter permease n=1 Tax=Paenibacillus albidus TaxID=2041023 RepID=A0A917C499_9BACL|nr:ABC transporter permease subunit [Paenibacillus albidus]GGF71651.1 sugar ABC transporter permease [Paenibacillus albidus]
MRVELASSSFKNKQAKRDKGETWRRLKSAKYLYLMLIPACVWVIAFAYAPMFGLYMAFVNYQPGGEFWSQFFTSKFVGLDWFVYFYNSGDFLRLMRNTLLSSAMTILISFPAPIIIALALNEVKNKFFKKTVQSVAYLPYFVSWVIAANIFITLLSSDGMVNGMLKSLGLIDESILFFQEKNYFWSIVASANTWKSMGYNSIIYLAAIAGINPEQYEASTVDGANKWKQMLHITLPSLKPTAIILLILAVANVMNTGFDQYYLMQNESIMATADVIDTYTYRYGLSQGMFSYAAAVGLFKSVVSIILLTTINKVFKRALF